VHSLILPNNALRRSGISSEVVLELPLLR
jgi:hypothetical protein